MQRLSLALDIGGTFTDCVLVDSAEGKLWTTKVSSTPDDPASGFLSGVDKVVRLADIAADKVSAVLHGSTIVTNAVLESRGARAGMLVTQGFKYVLEIGRHDIPRQENLFSWVKPKRPIPPRLIAEVPERVLLDGSVETPLDEEACRVSARRLKALSVKAIAIVFLHSYANPSHEQRAREIVREEVPDAEIAISSDVLPVFREYERSMATALNVSVQRLVSGYLSRLKTGLSERGIAAPLLIMKSNGGVYSPERAARQAINMALSGPAAGVVGASFLAQAAGFEDIVTIDVGGTSADVSLVRGATPQTTTEGEIGPFPLALPIIDIHTIGAGGGSLATITAAGSLVVGPESAGANPGPACYGRGGKRPTVTDANLLLGRLPENLAGGEIRLDRHQAEAAIADHVARPLGLATMEAAAGIIRIINANMTNALKVVSVEKGYDPREFALMAFGGAGPLHAAELARSIGSGTVLVPRHPGLLCALGLLATDRQFDYARTAVQRPPNYDLQLMEDIWSELEASGDADLDREGVPPERRRFIRLADLRYAKQGMELSLEVPGDLASGGLQRLLEAFHDLHERLYTFAERSAGVEFVTFRLKALGLVDKIALPELASAAGQQPQPEGSRDVYFEGRQRESIPVYRREGLLAGQRLHGPAIVDQLDSTTIVFPDQEAEVDRFGNLHLHWAS